MLNRRLGGRPADRSVFAEMAREAENYPTRVALIMKQDGEEKTLSYAELIDRAWRDAVKLAALGVVPGSRVALLCENRPDWLCSYLALSAAAAKTIAIGDELDDDDVRAALDGERAKVIIGSTEALGRLSPSLRDELRAGGVRFFDFDRDLGEA